MAIDNAYIYALSEVPQGLLNLSEYERVCTDCIARLAIDP